MWWYITAAIFQYIFKEFCQLKLASYQDDFTVGVKYVQLSNLLVLLVWGVSFVYHQVLLCEVHVAIIVCTVVENYVPLFISALMSVLLSERRGSDMLDEWYDQTVLLFEVMTKQHDATQTRANKVKAIIAKIDHWRKVHNESSSKEKSD